MNNDAFLILFIAFIALMGIGPLLLRRFHIPSVISLLIVGMLVGPNCLDLIPRISESLSFLGSSPAVVASHFESLVDSLGSLGLVLLMALAGMEADFKLIAAAKKPVVALSVLTFLLPAIAGYAVYAWFRPMYYLEKDSNMTFDLNYDVEPYIKALFPYTDKDGHQYISFQNGFKNQIVFYDIQTKEMAFKIDLDIEGDNGVGFFLGYYIDSLDSIYLTSLQLPEIYSVNKEGKINKKIYYGKSKDGNVLNACNSLSFSYHPILKFNNNLFVLSECNRWKYPNPVSAMIDLNTGNVQELPFEYPRFSGADNKKKNAGVELYFSRCFNGDKFIYSFFYEEDIFITSIDHNIVERVNVKSNYIDRVVMPNDYNETLKSMCENPNYGNLLYDKYRDVYYRVCYLKTEIDNRENYMELWDFGRKIFSIIILDKNFNIIGETVFPEYTYNPNLMYIDEKGLYISENHYKNPNYDDDKLIFRLFRLCKSKEKYNDSAV